MQSDGKEIIIESIEIEHLENPETTYNFEVQDFHTYFVTESNVLVHNKCETTLYRSMSNEEYGRLVKYGEFSTKPGSMAEKWMATSYDDALAWGKKFYGDFDFRIVEVRVPTSSLKNMYFGGLNLDGIGPAYSAHYKY